MNISLLMFYPSGTAGHDWALLLRKRLDELSNEIE